MGQHSTCNLCSFEYTFLLDHATKETGCLCRSCLANFAIVHESRFGASPGEQLNLWETSKRGRQILTNQTVRVIADPDIKGVVKYLIEMVSCPNCDAFEVVMGFDEGESCPKCKQGVLHVEFCE